MALGNKTIPMNSGFHKSAPKYIKTIEALRQRQILSVKRG